MWSCGRGSRTNNITSTLVWTMEEYYARLEDFISIIMFRLGIGMESTFGVADGA